MSLSSAATIALGAFPALANNALVHGNNNGIGNNITTTYTGANLKHADESAVNSNYSVQSGFLNASWVAQAGEYADVYTDDLEIDASLLKVKTTDEGNINMQNMFRVLNTSNSIGD